GSRHTAAIRPKIDTLGGQATMCGLDAADSAGGKIQWSLWRTSRRKMGIARSNVEAISLLIVLIGCNGALKIYQGLANRNRRRKDRETGRARIQADPERGGIDCKLILARRQQKIA